MFPLPPYSGTVSLIVNGSMILLYFLCRKWKSRHYAIVLWLLLGFVSLIVILLDTHWLIHR